MKGKYQISLQKRITVLFVGVFVALFTLLSSYTPNVETDSPEKTELTKEADQKDTKSQSSISTFNAVPNILQIQLPDFIDIISIDFPDEVPVAAVGREFPQKSTSKFFKTLFRYIISPNAP